MAIEKKKRDRANPIGMRCSACCRRCFGRKIFRNLLLIIQYMAIYGYGKERYRSSRRVFTETRLYPGIGRYARFSPNSL